MFTRLQHGAGQTRSEGCHWWHPRTYIARLIEKVSRPASVATGNYIFGQKLSRTIILSGAMRRLFWAFFDFIRTGIGNRTEALALWLQRSENHSAQEPPVHRKPEASGSVSMASSEVSGERRERLWACCQRKGLWAPPPSKPKAIPRSERERAIIDTL